MTHYYSTPPALDYDILLSLIDDGAWSRAKWIGTVFLGSRSSDPPALGVLFQQVDEGRHVFSDFVERIGRIDALELLRISIIEGDIPGQDPGYTVHVGTNLEAVLRRAESLGIVLTGSKVATTSRLHRMNPAPGSPHLQGFKTDVGRYGRYHFLPVTGDSTNLTPHFDLTIEKTAILFRRVEDIGPGDLDTIALKDSVKSTDVPGVRPLLR